jgi:ureidoglycolate dehydrogenase (NAD+)
VTAADESMSAPATIRLGVLEHLSVQVLEQVGVPTDTARLVAACLLFADARGVSSHGIIRLPIYVERIRQGMVDPTARPSVEGGDGPLRWVDARNGVGALGAHTGLETAREAAERHGLGMGGVRRSNHCGALGFYAERAARQGFIALAVSNAPVTMTYYGARSRSVGTNPLAIAVPRASEHPLVLDIATSATARGKIIEAAHEGRDIPPGWAVDSEGRPTTDAGAALEGSVLPLAGPKGSGLAMMIDLLAGALTGAATGQRIGDMYENWEEPQNVGHLFMVIDPAASPGNGFSTHVEEFIDDVRGLPPADGFDQVLLPGEIEADAAERAARDGVALPASTLRALRELAAEVGVDVTGLPRA